MKHDLRISDDRLAASGRDEPSLNPAGRGPGSLSSFLSFLGLDVEPGEWCDDGGGAIDPSYSPCRPLGFV